MATRIWRENRHFYDGVKLLTPISEPERPESPISPSEIYPNCVICSAVSKTTKAKIPP